MITALRHFLVDSWLGRVIAFVVFLSFVVLGGTFFGMGGGMAGLGGDTVVQIGSHKITPVEFQKAVQRQVGYAMQQNGGAADFLKTPQGRQEVGHAALRNLILVHEGALAGERNGLNPGDETIRGVIFAMPDFRDPSGKFDPHKMDDLLRVNNLSHQDLIQETRRMLYGRATMLAFGQTVQPPAQELDWMVNHIGHGQVVDMVRLPFSLGAVSTQPTDDQLKRYYQNHLWQFRKPEYRHARIVVMTAGSVAKTIQISDADLQASYRMKMQDPAEAARYNSPELRSIEVLAVGDEATAQELAAAWQGGQSWAALQKQYPKAIPATLNDARQTDLPDPALGKTAFATQEGKVSAPVHTAAGWSVVHVLSVKPATHASFESLKDSIREDLANARAASMLKDRQRAFEEAVAGSVTLDKVPADIGAFPLEGSLDAHGNLPGGEPAPLPGDAALRQALIEQIFSQKKDEPPHVVTEPDGSSFAVMVDDVTPGTQEPYEAVQQGVKDAWLADARKHATEQRVTALFQQAKKTGLRQALAGQKEEAMLQKDEHFSNLQLRHDVPALILKAALQQKTGQTAMLQAGDAYWLVNVTGTYEESSTLMQAIRQRLAAQMTAAYRNDLQETLGMSYTRAAPPRHFNAALFNDVNDRVLSMISGRLGQQ
ncbi:peptidylprolyl isomerase [Bombella sp. TMW 2.2559]|uniref:Parvulin-like PPIase n=1 Tax=Bombella dulcis TaxID=2967339 RepID=A0ABT3W995_9PROT|nr:peptidylprolyl isomerase [Bombella dulcis]MCX5615657.1 peptidylprolyl isomerase [Bombella dulcis]